MFPYVISVHSRSQAAALMRAIGVAGEGVELMAPAVAGRMLRLPDLPAREANIVKQEALAAGGDAALPAALYGMEGEGPALVTGSPAQMAALAERLGAHGGGLAALGEDIAAALAAYEAGLEGHVPLPGLPGDRPWVVMGILNVTPDSFYDGGRYHGVEAAVARARRMQEEGAGIIDVGGESTRPGARGTDADEELARVMPVIEALVDELEVPISIDTSKARVAEAALSAGAKMVNDVTGMTGDAEMAGVVSRHGCPVCIMHMQGRPRDMQQQPRYRDVVAELVQFFHQRIEAAVAAGIPRENILIDPGIGFGKELEHNLELFAHLDSFLSLGRPLLIGASRKSFIGALTGAGVEERLPGTLAADTAALLKGARVFRVHDVAAHVQALTVAAAVGGRP